MPNAVITGANRGIGREVARQLASAGWHVVLTGRSRAAIEEAAAEVGGVGMVLDVADTDSVLAFARDLQLDAVHALVNNAGAIFDGQTGPGLAGEIASAQQSFETNTLGALRVARVLAPRLRAGQANVVQVSSGMGGLHDMGGGHSGYRLSKAAMNAVTRILHSDLNGAGVRVNSVCPGWVQTDMGGRNATRTVEEGASGVVWAATLQAGGPSGGFFRDGQRIDW